MKKISTLITSLILLLAYGPMALAQDGFQTELGKVSTFGELTSLTWSYGSKVLIVLAVFTIVLGAFFYIASAGDEERITEGRQMMFGSVIALLIVMFSGVVIRTLHKPAENTAGHLSEVPNVIGNATNILVSVIGAFSLIMLIYSAFLYFAAQGNRQKIEKAHAALKYSIYGVIIGSLAYTLVNTLVKFLI